MSKVPNAKASIAGRTMDERKVERKQPSAPRSRTPHSAPAVTTSDRKSSGHPLETYLNSKGKKTSLDLGGLLTHASRSAPDDADEGTILSALKMLRGVLFKPDHPYRTRLGLSSTLTTDSAGLLNQSYNVSNVSSATEWTSIDALFDEVFVHSMTVRYQPYNVLGGGVGITGAAAPAQTTLTTNPPATLTNAFIVNCGLLVVSSFVASPVYTTADAMLANPNVRHHHTAHAWSYTWRNNVKFDPRGISFSGFAANDWLGWCRVTDAGNLGGLVQFRTLRDQKLGDTAHAFTCGSFSVVYDISFRVRA